MYCKNCGTELRDSAKYCPRCGSAVSNRKISENNLANNDISKKMDRPAKEKGHSWFVAIIAVAIVAVVAVGSLICYQTGIVPFHLTRDPSIESIEDDETLAWIEEEESEEMEAAEDTNQPATNDEEESVNQPEIVRTEGYVAIINAYASSQLVENKRGIYSATHVYDNNLNTPWCEAVDGDGIGEWIEVELDGEYEVTALEFYNGFMESYALLNNNSQICNATLEFSDGSRQSIIVGKNSSLDNPIVVRLNTPVVTSSIKITIDSAYSGEEFADTCLAELRVIAYDGTAQMPALIHLS